MQKWDYLNVSVTVNNQGGTFLIRLNEAPIRDAGFDPGHVMNITEALKHLGEFGWEMVALTWLDDEHLVLFFKRPIA
jgi:hypothetical protein